MRLKKTLTLTALSIATLCAVSHLWAKDTIIMQNQNEADPREAASQRMIARDPTIKELLKMYHVTNVFDLPKTHRYRYNEDTKVWTAIEKKK